MVFVHHADTFSLPLCYSLCFCQDFQEVFKAHVPVVETVADTTTEEIWAKLKTGLLKTTEEVCGTTKPHRWRRETWWWNKEVDDAITAKRQAFKA